MLYCILVLLITFHHPFENRQFFFFGNLPEAIFSYHSFSVAVMDVVVYAIVSGLCHSGWSGHSFLMFCLLLWACKLSVHSLTVCSCQGLCVFLFCVACGLWGFRVVMFSVSTWFLSCLLYRVLPCLDPTLIVILLLIYPPCPPSLSSSFASLFFVPVFSVLC